MDLKDFHEIFVSHNKVCCTCGVQKQFVSYMYARKYAEKHARQCNTRSDRYLIRPF